MLILGIDPGTGRTGYGIIEKVPPSPRKSGLRKGKKNGYSLVTYGCITTPKEEEMSQRLFLIQEEIKKLLQQYKPTCIALEQLFFGANARTAMSVGQARGVIMATAAAQKVPIFEYTGLQVKLVVAGYGRAEKKIVQNKVRSWLGINSRTAKFSSRDHAWDDAADALAIAICHTLKSVKAGGK